MTVLAPWNVLWTEGLLLGPQHLQQNDRYHEDFVAQRIDAIASMSWGALALDIDRAALARGEVLLERFEGVLPDGTPLKLAHGSLESPPTRPVERFGAESSSLRVYLAVPRDRTQTALVGTRGRYSPETRSIRDGLTEGGEHIDVELARRNVRILFEHEPREDFAALPIAEVVRDVDGRCVLDESFIPPCLRIGTSPALIALLDRVLGRVQARRTALLASRRFRDAETIEADATDITRFMLLHALSQAAAVLSHLRASRDLSPRAMFRELIALSGALSVYSVDASIDVPAFDPLDLRGTFVPLVQRIERLLGETQRESCIVLELEGREDGLYLGRIEDKFGECDRFLLAVRTDVTARQAESLLPSIGKVASWKQVTHVVSAALPGAKVEVVHRPPPEVPVRAGELYFSIEAQGAYWNEIRRDRSIALFLPKPFEPKHTKVSLLGLLTRSATSATPGTQRALSGYEKATS